MRYGPHHRHVQDVLDFLDERMLLRRTDVLRDATVKLIGNTSEIERYHQLSEGVDPLSGALTWIDIHRTLGTGDHTISLRASHAIGPALDEELDRLFDEHVRPLVIEQLRGAIDQDCAEDIAIDFEMIMHHRAAFGQNVPFIERLLNLYKAGGYPCGWDGLFPDGRIVVYHPRAPQ